MGKMTSVIVVNFGIDTFSVYRPALLSGFEFILTQCAEPRVKLWSRLYADLMGYIGKKSNTRKDTEEMRASFDL